MFLDEGSQRRKLASRDVDKAVAVKFAIHGLKTIDFDSSDAKVTA